MIKILANFRSTSDYYWTPWNWTTDPFPAFRGTGAVHQAFLAVANNFTPWFLDEKLSISDDTSAIIKTKKGGLLLVPRPRPADERILLISAKSAFRGDFSKLEVFGGEILLTKRSSKHCYEIAHLVVRLTDPDGYVMMETGNRNRSSYGEVSIYSWKGGYFTMPTDEYETAVELGQLFATHDTIQGDLEQCREERERQALSRGNKVKCLPRLEKVNLILESCNVQGYDLSDKTFFTEGDQRTRHLYTDDEVREAEKKAATAQREAAQREAYKTWKPRFVEATKDYTFTDGKTPWNNPMPEYLSNCVSVWSVCKDKFVHYEYSEDELKRFVADLPTYEAEYQDQLREKAKAEAEKRDREAREEAERLAREAAAEKQAKAEAEAKELGLPGNIRIWHRNGRTDAGKGWVIGQNGRERECDEVDTMVCGSNSKRYHQNYEGDHVWNQILPGELVLKWSKAYTAADHVCEIVYCPESISEAQLEHVAEIEQELTKEWEGMTGLASGKESPAIRNGWLAQLRA